MLRKQMAIISGSGSVHSSTMHTGSGNINYVSYYVRHIHFEAEFWWRESILEPVYPAYAVLFKIPIVASWKLDFTDIKILYFIGIQKWFWVMILQL